MKVHVFNAWADSELMEVVRRMRYQVYCIDEQYEPASDYPSGIFLDDEWDNGAMTCLVEDEGKYLASCRVIWDNQRPFPCEVYCTADKPLPDSPLAECSRIIAPRARDKTGLRSTRTATFEMLKVANRDSWNSGCNGTVGAVDDRFLKMLNRAGLPFKPLGPYADYHGKRRLVGYSFSEVKDPKWRIT